MINDLSLVSQKALKSARYILLKNFNEMCLADLKLFALSETIDEGISLLPQNLLKVFTNVFVVISRTTSKWKA